MMRKASALFICDIQEGFRNVIHEFPTVISTASKLLSASKALSIPVFVTTQNTKRLGPTVNELTSVHLTTQTKPVIDADKSLFSMMTPSVRAALSGHPSNIDRVAIVGIESHVCVLQTALDLRKMGYSVYIIADGVSSCNKEEIPIALARMRRAGCHVTTSESWLYEVMGDSNIPQFRDVLKIVKATLSSTKDNLGKLCKSSL